MLFVCTGNICRSPMAEYLFRSRIAPGFPFRAGSAGLSATDGLAASQTAVEVMNEIGLNMKGHSSRALSNELVDESTIILVMTSAHAAELKRRFPKARDRVHLLGSFSSKIKSKEILDPVGSTIEIYRGIRNDIAGSLDGLIRYLLSLHESKHQK